MANPIADMLLVSRRAAVAAMRSGDERELARAVELAYRVITHPGATNFFQALASAVRDIEDDEDVIGDAELFGNDPDVLDNGDGVNPVDPSNEEIDDMMEDSDVDEDSDASNPADEGLVNHDEQETAGRVRIDSNVLNNANALPWMGMVDTTTDPQCVVAAVVRNFSKFSKRS